MFFGIMIIFMAIFGVLRILGRDGLESQIKQMKKRNIVLENLVDDLQYTQIKDSSINNYKNFVYSNENSKNINNPPVNGYVTRGLNVDNKHFGIDIAAKYRDNITSPGDGKVIFSGENTDLGNTIIISHSSGFVSVFAHNDTNFVISGSIVEKGDVIALVGESGNSKGPHLHFEIWKNNIVLDPREIIPIYKKRDVSIR